MSGEDHQAYMEECVDALDHIRRVAHASRTQTRRLRWIEVRARCAVEGGEDWRDMDLPASAESQSKRVLNLLSQRSELESKLHDALAAQAADKERIKKLEEALRFYADKQHIRYGALETRGRDAGWPELLTPEDGATARSALGSGGDEQTATKGEVR